MSTGYDYLAQQLSAYQHLCKKIEDPFLHYLFGMTIEYCLDQTKLPPVPTRRYLEAVKAAEQLRR